MFLSHGGFFSISVRNLELTLCKNGTVFLGSLLRESPFASDVEFCLVCTMCYNLYFSSFTVVMGGGPVARNVLWAFPSLETFI